LALGVSPVAVCVGAVAVTKISGAGWGARGGGELAAGSALPGAGATSVSWGCVSVGAAGKGAGNGPG
jgi:hypothetical protein